MGSSDKQSVPRGPCGPTGNSVCLPIDIGVNTQLRPQEIVRDAGFRCACTTFKALLASDTNRFEIPRLQMHEYNGPEFDRVLDELLA